MTKFPLILYYKFNFLRLNYKINKQTHKSNMLYLPYTRDLLQTFNAFLLTFQ